MMSKISSSLILLVLSTAYSLPTGEVDKVVVEKEVSAADVAATLALPTETLGAGSENLEPKPQQDQKWLLPFLNLNLHRPPPPPPPTPRPPPTQTVIIPPGTPVAVNTNQPITVQQQGTTLISPQG